MKKHSDTIIINGKHFNAKTGHALDSSDSAPQKSRNVDGILPQHVKPVVLESPYHHPIASTVKKPVMDIVRTAAPHATKRRAQPGQTLMRSALKKPQPTLKRTTKLVTVNPGKANVTIANLAIKISATTVDDRKMNHAQLVKRSTNVRRFTPLTHVQPATLSLNSVVSKQAADSRDVIGTHVNQKPSLDLFERALATAVSHEQITPPHVNKSLKKSAKSGRTSRLVASSLAVLLITGFVGFQNLPNMKFHYASSQAGFRAELPDYRPPGFSVGKLSYETGAVRVSFTSNSDSRAFSITQQPSSWDNEALRENFFTQNNLDYDVSSAAGRVLYTYGNNNATWLNDGVWYDLKTDGSLTERQLVQIASTL